MLILFFQVTRFCNDSVVESMEGEVIGYERQMLKEPKMIVALPNQDEVEVESEMMCGVGKKVLVVHVEGNCRSGWYFDGEC